MTDDTKLILEEVSKLNQRMDKFEQRMDKLEAQIEDVKTTLKEDILRSRMEFAAKLRESMASLPTKEDYNKLFEYIEFIDKEISAHRTSTEMHLVSHRSG